MRHYRRVYDTYSSISGLDSPRPSKYKSLWQNLGLHLQTVPPKEKVLDIGSGQGELLDLCRNLGVEAEGVDISNELVQACNRRGLEVTLIDNLQAFLRSRSNEYWLVSMIDVLEHFTKAEAYEIVGLIRQHALRPGGMLILQVPNMQSPFAALNLFHDLTHEWGYTEFSLRQLLLTLSFEKVDFYPQNYPLYGLNIIRHFLRVGLYALFRVLLLVDQPNRGRVLTPNLIAIAES